MDKLKILFSRIAYTIKYNLSLPQSQKITPSLFLNYFSSLSQININSFSQFLLGSSFIYTIPLYTMSYNTITSNSKLNTFISNYYTQIILSFPLCSVVGNGTFMNTKIANINLPQCSRLSAQAFQNCSYLTSINLPQCSYVDRAAFKYCSQLTSINLPQCSYINDEAFNGCTQLTSINLPQCSYIGSSAFQRCINLSQLALSNCTTIGAWAFYSCTQFQSLYLLNSQKCTLQDNNAFTFTSISIFVPASLINTYKTASDWSQYSSQIFAIEDYPPPAELLN